MQCGKYKKRKREKPNKYLSSIYSVCIELSAETGLLPTAMGTACCFRCLRLGMNVDYTLLLLLFVQYHEEKKAENRKLHGSRQ